MKILVISACICLTAHVCFSQVNILNASTLSPLLLENAHSVKREEKINFEVKDVDEAWLTVHKVITVLDAEGEDALYFVKYSDQFRKLNDAEIKVYDANGKQMNKYKMREMKSDANGEGLVEDGKVYYFRVAAPTYPLTVQYDYEVKYKGTLNYPDYDIESPDQSVEYSTYTASIPANLDLKFKAKNISLSPTINNSGKTKNYAWEVKNLAAIKYEAGDASYESSYPQILITPNKFSMDGYEGDLATWKDLGIWYANLSKNCVNLSDQTKIFLKESVKDAKNDKEKIKIIYNYLQNNFRYVSIQLGIGGYKPFDANFVDAKKYGDCKALSNYMHACLDAVGVVSYPALINAKYNNEPVDPAFPHNSFNHVILCVPEKKDTIWLECTSNATDMGILGSFTENRNALLITPEGGVLVATPKSKPSENTFSLTTKISLAEDASGETESVLDVSGEYKEDMINDFINEKKDDQKSYLVSQFGFLAPDEFDVTTERKDESLKSSFKLFIEKIPEFTAGSKMFLNPRIYKIWNSKLPATKKRTKTFYFTCPFTKTDTTTYVLPQNYTVENLPKPRDLKFEYGFFKTKYLYDEKANTVTSIAILQLNQNIIPAEKFDETRNFFGNVVEEYTEKIIIKRK